MPLFANRLPEQSYIDDKAMIPANVLLISGDLFR